MNVFANGCSWTWGGGLESVYQTEEERLKLLWPYHLGQRLSSAQVTNLSMGGGSNARIFRTTFNWLSKQSPEELSNTIAIIQFTNAARNEFYFAEDRNNPYENYEDRWVKYKPGWMSGTQTIPFLERTDLYRISQEYYRLHSYQLEFSQFAANVFSMAGLFETFKVKKYWFWWQDAPMPGISEESKNALLKAPWIENRLADPFKYERVSDTDAHPGVRGHKEIADQIYNFIHDRL